MSIPTVKELEDIIFNIWSDKYEGRGAWITKTAEVIHNLLIKGE